MSKAIGNIESFYEILGISFDANPEEIEQAYINAIFSYNQLGIQSKNQEWNSYILEITKAYTILSDQILREKYNRTLDFDIVILDKNIDKTELAELSIEYKKYSSSQYDKILFNYNKFKIEMNETLWLLKTSSVFFFFNILFCFSSLYTIMLLTENSFRYNYIYKFLYTHSISLSFAMIVINFILFRFLWQEPILNQKRRIK